MASIRMATLTPSLPSCPISMAQLQGHPSRPPPPQAADEGGLSCSAREDALLFTRAYRTNWCREEHGPQPPPPRAPAEGLTR